MCMQCLVRRRGAGERDGQPEIIFPGCFWRPHDEPEAGSRRIPMADVGGRRQTKNSDNASREKAVKVVVTEREYPVLRLMKSSPTSSPVSDLLPITTMAIFGLWVINKAGGLVYHRSFGDGLPQLTANEYLIIAGTLHGIHAITSRLSPTGPSSGTQVIEGETFKLNILLTHTGTKFILLTSLVEPTADAMLQKVYEIYAEAVMKNPFHTPEMPIRTEGFDTKITALLGSR